MRIKKLLLPIIALAIMVALGACSNEEIMQDVKPQEEEEEGRTLLLTASMPSDGPATRVGLTQEDDKTITLTWEATDELQLAFVQDDTKVINTAKVATLSTDKKKATFKIIIPTDINLREVFDLYGVYGAGVIDITGTNPIVTLPLHLGTDTSLDDVQNRKNVMLSFTSKQIDIAVGNISTAFAHLGSLFSITVKNTSTESLYRMTGVSLNGIDNPNNLMWAYNTAQTSAQTYDLVKKEFQNPELAGNYIVFRRNQNDLAAGATTTFWAWNPPLPEVSWPALQLKLFAYKGSSPFTYQSANALPARNNPTAAGKAYYFYATWDGNELNFTNESFTNELTIDVADMGTLSNLLSTTQKANTTKLTLTGQINKADYDVMKLEMPSLTHVDLSQVTSYEGEIVNKIPDAAFGYSWQNPNSTLTTIILPASVTSIGNQAFRHCEKLEGSLTIPDGVTTIGVAAFKNCSSFTGTLTLPAGLTIIEDSAFCYSGFDGSLIIPDNVIAIGNNAFDKCKFTGTLVLPSSLETIGNKAFFFCEGFTGSLTIPNKVESIKNNAFWSCCGFTDLTLPEGLKTIGDQSFEYCNNITGTVAFPSSLTSIGYSGFDYCNSATAFQFPHTTPIAYTAHMLPSGKKVEVQAQAVATYQGADGWNTHPIVPMFDEYAINVATKGTMSTLLTPLQKANIRKLTVTGQINKADYDVMKSQMPNLRVVDLGEVTSYEGETLNKIPDEAFEANFTITTITLPESVTVIGNYAFRNCEQLRGELILPNGLEIIGDGAFYYCPGFTGSLIIPDNVTTIGYEAFSSCSGFNGSLILPEGLKTIGINAFAGCNKLSGSLILPKGLTTIGAYAFFRCNKITGTVTFPSTLTSIGTFGFFESNSIEAFQFPHTTPITYTSNMLPAGTTVEVPGSAVMLYLDNADWVPRHPISVYVDVEVEVPPL